MLLLSGNEVRRAITLSVLRFENTLCAFLVGPSPVMVKRDHPFSCTTRIANDSGVMLVEKMPASELAGQTT
ncbi:MAG: hypothetical protein J0M17_09120 [Planctomycetes bacterium]|jgi:hypothetical protein|nr:hypothetical protein [Planctomycetota bacterium]